LYQFAGTVLGIYILSAEQVQNMSHRKNIVRCAYSLEFVENPLINEVSSTIVDALGFSVNRESMWQERFARV